MKNTLNTILAQTPSVLQKHPAVGGLGGVGGGILYWIEIAGPVLSFVGVVLGVGVAAITLHLKMMEWKEKRKKLNN
tara:strand:+ start:550 stop:777 length:228 start_codon:yes stop_codon:yes gene_type:complete